MKSYNDYVFAAKEKLKQVKNIQAEIAKMAINVCDIRHGGISSAYYTMKDFSDDIGMNHATLAQWVAIYRNVLVKCDIKNPTPDDWKAASKTDRMLKNRGTVNNTLSGHKGTLKNNRKNAPKAVVKDMFEAIQGGDKHDLDLDRLYTSSRHIICLAKRLEMDVVDENTLIRIMENLDSASDVINNFLTENKRNKAS